MTVFYRDPERQIRHETRSQQVRDAIAAGRPWTANDELRPCPFCFAPGKHVREDGVRFVQCYVNHLHRAGDGCHNAAPGKNGDSGKCDLCFKLNLECIYAEQEWNLRDVC